MVRDNKNSIYMFQPNYLYGKTAHLPYAVGTIIAFAFNNPIIEKHYKLEKIGFLRESISKVVLEMKKPFLVGFSTYVWNFEYNLALARAIKKTYPNCKILFGGHHVNPGQILLEKYEFIDILIHGEGEEVFSELLLSLIGERNIEDIPNISYRSANKIISNPPKLYKSCDYPSPYLEGVFDSIIAQNTNLDFMFLFESNRGCAYNCSYCDWGSLNSEIRKFPLERVRNEFLWMCKNRIEFCGCADANFGILERDSTIIDWLIELKQMTGYPKKFQASYSKNSTNRIFEMSKKLNDNNMNKGVTLAFQTMSEDASLNVGRKNISLEHFSKLMRLYNQAKIPTYTELILGLPGETYKSFTEGISRLLEAGQHHSIYVHNCELLPNSHMGSREYIEKYEIETNLIPLNQPHMEFPKDTEVQEFSRIITKTYSMSKKMWIDMNMFSIVVQAFHHMGLLQFFAIYLFEEKNIKYVDFYKALIDYMLKKQNTVCGRVFLDIKNNLELVTKGNGSLVCYDDRFGDIAWPFEEYAYLRIVFEANLFYEEIVDFFKLFNIPDDVFKDLLTYQKNMIKRPNISTIDFVIDHNLYQYFRGIFEGEKVSLTQVKNSIKISDNNPTLSFEDFARFVVWYGRKDSKNVYTEGIQIKE